jgi:hypothetical protein
MRVHVTSNDVIKPRHHRLITAQSFNLTVCKIPRRSIDLRFSLLRGSASELTESSRRKSPEELSLWTLGSCATCPLRPMVEIYFGVRDFGGFHTLKTLGQIPLEYEVSGPWDRLPRTRSSNGPGHFDSSTFGSSTCISRLSFRTTPDLLPRVPSIYDQDLLWLAELRGKLMRF